MTCPVGRRAGSPTRSRDSWRNSTPTTARLARGPDSASLRHPGTYGVASGRSSELGHLGVGRSDPFLLSAEVDQDRDFVLNTDDYAKSVPVVRYLIVQRVPLDRPDYGRCVEGASWQVAPGGGAGWFHQLPVCATWDNFGCMFLHDAHIMGARVRRGEVQQPGAFLGHRGRLPGAEPRERLDPQHRGVAVAPGPALPPSRDLPCRLPEPVDQHGTAGPPRARGQRHAAADRDDP